MVRLSLVNHFLFLIPPLIWNAMFTSKLPMEYFPGAAPTWLTITQGIARFAVIGYTLLLPITTDHGNFNLGLVTYIVGLTSYFGTWTLLMVLPKPALDRWTLLHFTPSATPLVLFVGIAVMARSNVLLALTVVFIVLHVLEYAIRFGRP